jgi:hypothetical protein
MHSPYRLRSYVAIPTRTDDPPRCYENRETAVDEGGVVHRLGVYWYCCRVAVSSSMFEALRVTSSQMRQARRWTGSLTSVGETIKHNKNNHIPHRHSIHGKPNPPFHPERPCYYILSFCEEMWEDGGGVAGCGHDDKGPHKRIKGGTATHINTSQRGDYATTDQRRIKRVPVLGVDMRDERGEGGCLVASERPQRAAAGDVHANDAAEDGEEYAD